MQSMTMIIGQPEWIKPLKKKEVNLKFEECLVCFYKKKTKALNCKHNLCLDCIDNINSNNKSENLCPLCEKKN